MLALVVQVETTIQVGYVKASHGMADVFLVVSLSNQYVSRLIDWVLR